MTYNRYRRIEGRYDWCNPAAVQAQYIFELRREGAPTFKLHGFTVPLDRDEHLSMESASPLDCAEFLVRHYETYLYASEKPVLLEIREYLETVWHLDNRDYLADQVSVARRKLERYELLYADACAEADRVEREAGHP